MASLRKLRKATKKNPRDPGVWFELGVAALQEGEALEAEEALRIALALVPPAPLAISLGQIFHEMGRPAEALRAFRRAAELEPSSAEACASYAMALGKAGDREWGLEQLRRLADRAPTAAEPTYLLATHLLDAGHREQAIAALLRAIEIIPNHQPSLALLGRCWREDGEYQEAKAVLEQAVVLNPSDLFARVDLGVVLAKTGQHEAGLRAFREVLNRAGDSAELLVKIGIATREIGDLDMAIHYLRDAVRIGPTLVEAHLQLGLMLLEEGSDGAATVALGRAVELAPSSSVALYHLGVAYQRCGDLGDAERAFTQASVMAPDDTAIQDRLREVQAAQAAQLQAVRAGAAPAAPRPASASHPDLWGAAMVGALEDFALPDLLQLLRAARRSGVLYLSAGELAGEVRLVEGAITSASSPRAGLGQILMDEHNISPEQLADVVGMQREGNRHPVGALLVERGLLDQTRLDQAVETQIKTAIGEIVGWTHGHFAFEPLKHGHDEQVDVLRFDVDRVLLDILQDARPGESSPPPSPSESGADGGAATYFASGWTPTEGLAESGPGDSSIQAAPTTAPDDLSAGIAVYDVGAETHDETQDETTGEWERNPTDGLITMGRKPLEELRAELSAKALLAPSDSAERQELEQELNRIERALKLAT